MTKIFHPAERVLRLETPELISSRGHSLRALERELERAPAGPEFLDATYANTDRFPPEPWALEEFTRAARGGGMTYTPYRGDAGVRHDVAEHVSDLLGLDVDPTSSLILTPGTQAALYTALASIVDPGDKVVIPDPDYITSERSVRYLGAEVVSVPLVWEDGASPHLDLDELRKAVQQAKLVMLSHPNNPTGVVFDEAHVREIAEVVASSDAWLLIDQLYCRLVYDDTPFAHIVAEAGMAKRTITTLGPSKTESLSGYRIGLAVAPPEIVDRMEDVMGIAALRCPAYAQHVLTRWLDDDKDYVASRITEYQHLRDTTVNALREMPGVQVTPSGGSAYLFPDCRGLDATEHEIALRLKTDAGIVVNPGYQFGSRGLGHLRLCFAQDEGAWNAALERMTAVLASFDQV